MLNNMMVSSPNPKRRQARLSHSPSVDLLRGMDILWRHTRSQKEHEEAGPAWSCFDLGRVSWSQSDAMISLTLSVKFTDKKRDETVSWYATKFMILWDFSWRLLLLIHLDLEHLVAPQVVTPAKIVTWNHKLSPPAQNDLKWWFVCMQTIELVPIGLKFIFNVFRGQVGICGARSLR